MTEKHPPELHAILLGLIEALPPLLPGLKLFPNISDHEIIITQWSKFACVIGASDKIKVWKCWDSDRNLAGSVDYADPDFITKTAEIVQRLTAQSKDEWTSTTPSSNT